MKVTIIQTDIQWAACDNNASAARDIILSAGESDMYVLPEMWNTGFTVTKEEVSAHQTGHWNGCRKPHGRQMP